MDNRERMLCITPKRAHLSLKWPCHGAQSSITVFISRAGIAQLIERRLAKAKVAGLSPVSRSNFPCSTSPNTLSVDQKLLRVFPYTCSSFSLNFLLLGLRFPLQISYSPLKLGTLLAPCVRSHTFLILRVSFQLHEFVGRAD